MYKKLITLGLVLLLSLTVVAPAFAQEGDEVGGDAAEPTEEEEVIPDDAHPIVKAIAERYGVTYAEVAGMFNGTMDDTESEDGVLPEDGTLPDEGPSKGHGLGEIMLAYQTAEKLGDGTSAAALLKEKEEMGGWGKVWQAHNLVGKDKVKPEKSNNGNSDNNGKDKDKSNNGNAYGKNK